MKTLRIDTEILDWEGQPIPWESGPDGQPLPNTPTTTLRRVLLRYLRLERHMPILSDAERDLAYEIGALLGVNQHQVDLTGEQYEALEKIVKHGKIGGGQTGIPEQFPFSVEVRVSAKRMVSEAQIVNLPRLNGEIVIGAVSSA